MPFEQGAGLDGDGAWFSVWAPDVRDVELVLEAPLARRITMRRGEDGFHSARVASLEAGARYRYALDGRGPFPDPASRFQPEGPHGPSMLVDPHAYRWRHPAPDTKLCGQVVYEMHIGTFTREGTFDAATAHFARLADLGVTVLEVMPIAAFPGRFNWGYDGVALYAPHHGYGERDAFKRFVDAAHGAGLRVILDVVYNHFGPDGAYHREFSAHWFTDRYSNEWGDALNYDGPQCEPVRAFVVGNAAYWIDEFRLDGLRLDATQSVHDASATHVLAEVARRAREAAGNRSILLIAENEPQDVRCLAPAEQGGFGLDAMWNDDYHHASRVALTGSREGYLHDYEGSPQEFVSAVRHCFLYQGQYYRWQKKNRGTRVTDEPAAAFVHFIQNHDQVANTLRGDRCSVTANPALVRTLTALTLLGPQTPMLFMGQEVGALQPFPFFADHRGDLGAAVRKGRSEFLAQFPSHAGHAARSAIPDPSAVATFEAAKLDLAAAWDNATCRLHRDLLRLRREEPAIAAQDRQRVDGAVLSERSFALRWSGPGPELLLIVNLGGEVAIAGSSPLLACGAGDRWSLLWSSEAPDYGGAGTISPLREDGWTLLPHSATLLAIEAFP